MFNLSWEELEARGLCECGQPSDPALHSPLRPPKPMGRPLASRLVIPRYGAVVRGDEAEARAFKQRQPTTRLEEVVRILVKNAGHRDRTARELGVSTPTVYAAIRRAKAMGMTVPAAQRGVRPSWRRVSA